MDIDMKRTKRKREEHVNVQNRSAMKTKVDEDWSKSQEVKALKE